jgi:hypothetical protein
MRRLLIHVAGESRRADESQMKGCYRPVSHARKRPAKRVTEEDSVGHSQVFADALLRPARGQSWCEKSNMVTP